MSQSTMFPKEALCNMLHTLKGLDDDLQMTVIALRRSAQDLQDKLKELGSEKPRGAESLRCPRKLLTAYLLLLRHQGCRTWQDMVFTLAEECAGHRTRHGAPSPVEFATLLAMAQLINFALIEGGFPPLSQSMGEFRDANLPD